VSKGPVWGNCGFFFFSEMREPVYIFTYLKQSGERAKQIKLFCLISFLSKKPATFGNNGFSDRVG